VPSDSRKVTELGLTMKQNTHEFIKLGVDQVFKNIHGILTCTVLQRWESVQNILI
jgi:hypothetical protein